MCVQFHEEIACLLLHYSPVRLFQRERVRVGENDENLALGLRHVASGGIVRGDMMISILQPIFLYVGWEGEEDCDVVGEKASGGAGARHPESDPRHTWMGMHAYGHQDVEYVTMQLDSCRSKAFHSIDNLRSFPCIHQLRR
jgi:hypothetical protein